MAATNPNHSLFGEPSPAIPARLSSSLWAPAECRSVVEAIAAVVGPTFNRDFEQYFVKENSFINLVLERRQGIPITLCVTVQAVARRLGVLLETISFPRHFLLRWLEHPMKQGIKRFTFVDPFNKNFSLSFDEVVETFSIPQVSPGRW